MPIAGPLARDMGFFDFLILGIYGTATLAAGLWFGRNERTTTDYFLGGRSQPWLAVGLSVIATEISALTFVNVPADAFAGDWTYLQLYVGSFLGRLLIIVLLLPAFYGGRVTTVYEYLGQRFGPCTRATAAMMFLTSRIIGSGIRLLAASLAIAVVFDWPLPFVICSIAGLAVAYATFGGIKAIIWTDVVQAVVLICGAVAAIVYLFAQTPGGAPENLHAAYTARKLHVFTFDLALNDAKSFWVLAVHALFMSMAALGTDQDLTQRMLTCPDLRAAQRSLLFNALLGFPIVCLFLLIGTLLYLYYDALPNHVHPAGLHENADRVFPLFIATALPVGAGIKGLLLAALIAAAMSSLDSALGALSSTVVTDFYRSLAGRRSSERHLVLVSRVTTFLAGVCLVVVALAFAGHDRLLWKTFEWVSLIFGGMLGVFLLGVTTRNRGRDGWNVVSMLSSVGVLVVVKWLQEKHGTVYIAWPWWIVIGTLWTYCVGSCAAATRGGPPGGSDQPVAAS